MRYLLLLLVCCNTYVTEVTKETNPIPVADCPPIPKEISWYLSVSESRIDSCKVLSDSWGGHTFPDSIREQILNRFNCQCGGY